MLFDQKLHKGRVTFHGCIMQTRPTCFALAINKSIFVQQGLAHFDAAKLRCQMKGTATLQVEDIHSAIIVQKDLERTNQKY